MPSSKTRTITLIDGNDDSDYAVLGGIGKRHATRDGNCIADSPYDASKSNPDFNPIRHGFDSFFGLPYSHDYNPPAGVPLFRNLEKVEQPVVYQTLTQRYTEHAAEFIRSAGKQPFFLYLAHNMPHIPVGTSERFRGHSRAGRYGDVVEEIDWSVGEVLRTLKETGHDRDTIVVLQSDNGPWARVGTQTYDRGSRGSKQVGDVGWAGLLRGTKGSTYEGGPRVPAIVRWPGHIPAGKTTAELAAVLDWFPTFVHLAGGEVPADRPFDGVDILPLLTAQTKQTPRKELLYFSNTSVQAIRQGSWKLRLAPPDPPEVKQAQPTAQRAATDEDEPELYNLDIDPAERYNRAAENPEIVARLKRRLLEARTELRSSSRPASTHKETVSALD